MPLLVKLQLHQHAQQPAYGASPLVPPKAPTQGQSLLISGITKNSAGAVLGSCEVDLFDRDTDILQGRTISDATTGAYSFTAGMGRDYYVRALDPTGLLAGTTLNLQVVAS